MAIESPPPLTFQSYLTSYKDNISSIRKMLQTLHEKKKSKDNTAKETKQSISIHLLNLLNLHRKAHIYANGSRENLQTFKDSVNHNFLSLESLLYHANHLHNEINSCFTLSSLHEKINLTGEQITFINTTTTTTYNNNNNNNNNKNEHSYMVNKLNFELTKRKELFSQVSELNGEIKRKETLSTDKVQYLEKIKHLLNNISNIVPPGFLNSSNMNLDITQLDHKHILRNLTAPFYTLYVELNAYCQAKSLDYKISIQELELIDCGENSLHPYSIIFKFTISGFEVGIAFSYDNNNNTVCANVNSIDPKPEANTDLWLDCSNLFDNLCSPNLINDDNDFKVYSKNEWSSYLCGIDLSKPNCNETNRSIAQTYTPTIITAMHQCITYRIAIAKQIRDKDLYIDSKLKLVTWYLLTIDELFNSLNDFQNGLFLSKFNPTMGYSYSGCLSYYEFKLNFICVISFHYPHAPPFFLVSLQFPKPSNLSQRVQEIEIEKCVNILKTNQTTQEACFTEQIKLLCKLFITFVELHLLKQKGVSIANTNIHYYDIFSLAF